MKVLFWFRKSEAKAQNSKDSVGSIQCRITIDNCDVEIGSTKITCLKSHWKPGGQMVTGNNDDSRRYNIKLSEIKTALHRLHDVLNTKYDFVSPSMVKEYFLSKRKFQYSTTEIIEAFLKHRNWMADHGQITESTLAVNQNYSRHIQTYATDHNLNKVVQIQSTFLTDIYEWMISNNRSGERFSRKVAAFAKQILKWAKKKSMAPDLSCFEEDLPGQADSDDDLDTTHLTILQIDKLYRFDFNELVNRGLITQLTATTLSEERHAFVFNCFTGMHHCEYRDKLFSIEAYKDSVFLKGKRRKTKKSFAIKLLSPAMQIMRLYNNNLEDLPVKSNQKRNQTLKLVAMYVGIPLVLTTKVARKTFTDLALNEMMMTQDDVAACLGLTSTRFLKNYGRIREERLIKVMKSWESMKQA